MSKKTAIMKKKNIRKCLELFLVFMLVALLMPSCSDDDTTVKSDPSDPDSQEVYLSIGGLSSMDVNTATKGLRSVGDPNNNDESEIYSYDVFIFKPDGTLDAYVSRPRVSINVSDPSVSYDKAYQVRDSIANIKCTAGTRDIFVIANGTDYYSGTTMTKAQFISTFTKDIDAQGQGTTTSPNAHPSGTTFKPVSVEPGIGGYIPSDLKTNLTMFGCALNVKLNPSYDNHYIGFHENGNGFPNGVTSGDVLIDPTYKFKLYRLASRIAIKNITLDLPTSLPLESGQSISDYEAYIDTVFLVNVKTASFFADSLVTSVPDDYFYQGDDFGYKFLKSKSLSYLEQNNMYNGRFCESTGGVKSYDITKSQSLLWFYTFENYNISNPKSLVTNPTTVVIGVRFDFNSKSSPGTAKTVKYYYPVQVNYKSQTGVDHLGVKRNHQYRLSVTIKALSNYGPSQAQNIKSSALVDDTSSIDVEEEVGTNLFPWNGAIYKDYTK